MTNHVIDNNISDLGKTVLWQYDKAYRLLSLIKHMQILFHCSVVQFWNWWNEKVLSIDSCGEFGATVWGILLGVRRPKVSWEGDEEHPVAISVYRKILKGAFYMMKAGADMADLNKYIELVYGLDGLDNVSPWRVSVNEYGWTTNIDELNGEYKKNTSYKKNDIFRHEGRNWLCKRDITQNENTSFDAIKEAVLRTDRRPTVNEKGDSLLLKLIDPNDIVRKIGTAPIDSLSIEVEYEIGDTVVKALAERNVKCGVSIEAGTNLDMRYTKSQYFTEMHRDQQALYEQHHDEFLPLPLGIRTNEPCSVSMFAFSEAISDTTQYRYTYDVPYAKDTIFIYNDEEGNTCNWKCLDDISESENTSIEAIRGKIVKTMDGYRDAVTFADIDPPYIDYRTRKFPYYQKLSPSLSMPQKLFTYKADLLVLIKPNEYFVGRSNGIDFIFKAKNFMAVYEDPKSQYKDEPYLNSENFLFVSDASDIDAVLNKLGDIALSHSLMLVSSDDVMKYEPEGTAYRVGMSVYVNGRLMTFKRGKSASEKVDESSLFYPTPNTTILSGGDPADAFWHNMENSIAFYKG